MKLLNILTKTTLMLTIILITNLNIIKTKYLYTKSYSKKSCITIDKNNELDSQDGFNYFLKPSEANLNYVYNKFNIKYDDFYLFIDKNSIQLNDISIPIQNTKEFDRRILSGTISNAKGLLKHYQSYKKTDIYLLLSN